MDHPGRKSSTRVSPGFCSLQTAMALQTNRKGKEQVVVVEPSGYKPQLSWLRDRDKLLLPRHRVAALEQGVLLNKCSKEFLLGPDSNSNCCWCSSSSISSVLVKEEEKTNGCSNSANNCPMTPLNYFGPSEPFFFIRRLVSSLLTTAYCPCSCQRPSSTRQCCFCWRCNNRKCNDKNNNDNKPFKNIKGIGKRSKGTQYYYTNNFRNYMIFPSAIMIRLVLCFIMLFSGLIQVGNATPLPSILTPTQQTTTALENVASSENTNSAEMKYFERLAQKRLEEQHVEQEGDELRHHLQHLQLYKINSTFDNDGSPAGVEDDEVRRMKNEMSGIDVNTTRGHSRARNLYGDSIKNDSSKNRSGGNQLEFLSPFASSAPQESQKSRNNKSKNENGAHSAMPLAMRFRAGLSSSSSAPAFPTSTYIKQEKQEDTSIPLVTNDLSQEIKESNSKNNDADENSYMIINNNSHNNNINQEDNANFFSSEPATIKTTPSTFHVGKCWAMVVGGGDNETEENEIELSPNSLLPVLSDSISSLTKIPRSSALGLVCSGTNHLAITLSQIPENFVHQVISIVVKDSLINTLNLSLFHRFSRLESISMTHLNITQVVGTCPLALKALNISYNSIRKLNSSIFTVSGNQEMEYEYEEDADDGDSSTDSGSNNDDGENMATNFSTEVISSFFGSSSTEEQQQERLVHENKSDPGLTEMLSALPYFSSSPEPHNEKMPINSRFKTDHYSKKLMGPIPFVQAGTKQTQASRIPFPSNNGGKRNELGEKDPSSVFGISVDQRQFQQPDDGLIKVTGRVNHILDDTGEDTILETAETNESSTDDDEDDERHNDETLGRKYSDAQTNNDKNGETVKRATPSLASRTKGSGNKEANTECTINNGLCKATKFARIARQVTREDLNGYIRDNRQPRSGKKSVSEGHDYHLRHYPRPTTSSRDIPSRSVASKLRNEVSRSNLKPTLFPVEKGTRGLLRKRKARTSTTTTSSSSSFGLSLEDIDLSYNKISDLPRTLLQLKSLKSLRLSGNRLKREFVWEKLADWYMNSVDPSILKDGDDTFCGVVDDVRVFQFTVLGVLKAKKDLVETCRKVDRNICHECGLYSLNKQPGQGYNLSHSSPHGNVAIALKLDCSYRNLSELPAVPPQTWQLNVSGNSIKDLIPLKESMYENLLNLDADANEINTLDGLIGTSFLDRYNYLSLQNNHFSGIPSNVLSSLKNMRGQGVTLLGANYIDCDCDTVKDTKPLLLENSKKIKDLKEIYCKDMKARAGESLMAVKDLQYTDLCYMDTEESNEMYLYLIILIELLLIFVIVAKVWHDQRTFRRTGILPWCSAKMPRLPCDAMLESVKEPPHFNRSSSTNVRSYTCEPPATQSISSCVQLREVRSNSGQSEKSSQISQLSSFPGSSRTSSV